MVNRTDLNTTSEPVSVVPTAEDHIESFHECLDSVARERAFLAITEAPPIDAVIEFARDHIAKALPSVVAVTSEGRVVGWCDVTPLKHEGFRHGGRLAMGVHRDYRWQGLGRRLMQAALDWSQRIGLERIELEVYASNALAISLYEKFGFVVEGVKRRARWHGRWTGNTTT